MDIEFFRAYVDSLGSQAAAGRQLDRSRAAICRIYSGKGNLTLNLARRIEEQTNGKFRAADLLGMGDRTYIQHD